MKTTSIRLNFRVPEDFYDRMMEAGQVLGLSTPSAAARHFLTVGVQQSANLIALKQNMKSQQVQEQAVQALNLQNDLFERLSDLAPEPTTKAKRRGKTKETE